MLEKLLGKKLYLAKVTKKEESYDFDYFYFLTTKSDLKIGERVEGKMFHGYEYFYFKGYGDIEKVVIPRICNSWLYDGEKEEESFEEFLLHVSNLNNKIATIRSRYNRIPLEKLIANFDSDMADLLREYDDLK